MMRLCLLFQHYYLSKTSSVDLLTQLLTSRFYASVWKLIRYWFCGNSLVNSIFNKTSEINCALLKRKPTETAFWKSLPKSYNFITQNVLCFRGHKTIVVLLVFKDIWCWSLQKLKKKFFYRCTNISRFQA